MTTTDTIVACCDDMADHASTDDNVIFCGSCDVDLTIEQVKTLDCKHFTINGVCLTCGIRVCANHYVDSWGCVIWCEAPATLRGGLLCDFHAGVGS